jgi:uroporphyrinogen decarboxylase
MNERENLLRTIHFELPDHIPITFHINGSCWHHYPQDALQDLMEAHTLLFPDFKRSPVPIVVEHPPYALADRLFTDPWGCVWETKDDGIIGTVIKHPLESWDSFDNYVPPDPDKTTHWGPIDWNEQPKDNGPAISQHCLPNGEIGHNHTWLKLIDIRGYENVIYDMADCEPRLYRLLEMLENFNMGLLDNYMTYVGIEWIGFAEDLGMQTGPMLSPEHFRKYIKPSYSRLMKKARDTDVIVHVHADGDLRQLMDDILECGVQVINLQDLVNGIDWIQENLAGKICVDLDIDRQCITRFGTPTMIDELIREEVEKIGSKEGGLMMIYGLYPDIPFENVKAVMDAMERYTDYYR